MSTDTDTIICRHPCYGFSQFFSCVCNFFYCDYAPVRPNVWDVAPRTLQCTLGFLPPRDTMFLSQSEFMPEDLKATFMPVNVIS